MCVVAWLAFAPVSVAETSVPIELQVELLRKLVQFERGFAARSGSEVRLLIVVRESNPASARASAQLQSAIERAHDMLGRPIKASVHNFTSAAALKKAALAANAQIVFFTPGFDADLAAIVSAFEGLPALTVSTDGDQVARGVVLGFELVSSKPKITLNLGQARRQGLDFNSELFRLARVIP